MEIRIKTAQEFRDSHVTIEIVADDVIESADIAQSVDQNMIDAGRDHLITELAEKVKRLERELAEARWVGTEVIAAQADDHAPDGPWDRLQKRAEEVDRLKRELTEAQSQRNQYQRERNDLTTEVRRLEARIQGLGVRHQLALADLRVEKAEQTQKAEVFKAQAYGENDKAAALRTQLAESRKLVTERFIQNRQALRILSTEQVEKDMDNAGTELSARLKEAIRAAREELRGTSQA